MICMSRNLNDTYKTSPTFFNCEVSDVESVCKFAVYSNNIVIIICQHLFPLTSLPQSLYFGIFTRSIVPASQLCLDDNVIAFFWCGTGIHWTPQNSHHLNCRCASVCGDTLTHYLRDSTGYELNRLVDNSFAVQS